MPMPQRGPRGSPVTERRQAAPAIVIAAATVVSSGTTTGFLLIRSRIELSMGCKPGRQIRVRRNVRSPPQELIGKQPRRSERGRNPQTFVARSQKNRRVVRGGANQRKLVRGRRTKASPDPQHRLRKH